MVWTRQKVVNSMAITIVSLAVAQVGHEFVHAAVASILGFEVSAFTLFAVDISLPTQFSWQVVAVEASASLVNIGIAVSAALLFFKTTGYWRWFCLMLVATNSFFGFGYLLFDSLTYTAGAIGDWRTILTFSSGNWVLRSLLMSIGASGYVASFFWLAKAILSFLPEASRNQVQARRNIGLLAFVVPYSFSLLFYLPLAFWHPLGIAVGFVTTLFQYVFGNSGLITAFLLTSFWLKSVAFQRVSVAVLSEQPHYGWWLVAFSCVVYQAVLAF